MHALVAPLRLETDREVAAVLVPVRLDIEEAILVTEGIVAAVAAFAFRQVIADAILAAELVHGEVGDLLANVVHALPYGFPVRGAPEIDGCDALAVFRFGQLLVEHAEFLLVEPGAAEAIRTAEAILAEFAIAAIAAILAPVAHVAFRAIDAFVAPLALHAEREPAATRTLARVSGIVHILAVEDAEAVVAILRLHGGIRVITILRPHLLEVVARLLDEKPLEVGEEGHEANGSRSR